MASEVHQVHVHKRIDRCNYQAAMLGLIIIFIMISLQTFIIKILCIIILFFRRTVNYIIVECLQAAISWLAAILQ